MSPRPSWLGEDSRGWDHIRVHRQLFEDQRLTGYDRLVYCGIAVHAENHTGDSHPSRGRLAEYADCSDRQISKSLRHLEELGYIRVEHRRGKTSVVRLLPPPSVTPAHHSGVGEPLHTVQDTPAHGARVIPYTNQSQLTIPSEEGPVVPNFVGYYVDRCKENGAAPISGWKKACGNQAKKLFLEGKSQELIEAAIDVAVAERRNPGVLANIVMDLEVALARGRAV